MTEPKRLDVSRLPTYAFGASNPLWWGNQAYMVIEGLGFLFAVATYVYLYAQNKTWPLAPEAPGVIYGSVILGVMLISEIPNVWLKRIAKKHDLRKVRRGLVVMSLVGLVILVLRWFEFKTLGVKWDDNAYGSIVWFLLGLHTLHLVTDVGETLVMTVLIHVGPVDMRRFPEVEDNQDYWHFVIGFWILVYATIYWFPRWFAVVA